jgi:hypothetical protein
MLSQTKKASEQVNQMSAYSQPYQMPVMSGMPTQYMGQMYNPYMMQNPYGTQNPSYAQNPTYAQNPSYAQNPYTGQMWYMGMPYGSYRPQ